MFRLKIRELREQAGYTSQQSFADAFGVAQTTVASWEGGKRMPGHKTMLRLADFFNVTVDYLLGHSSETERAPTQEGGRSDAVRIPVLGSVPAGIPIEAIEDILDWEEIPASMCRGGKEYFALQVKGDSMWPEYLAGDVVIVRRTPDCETGDDCIVYVNGYEATLKTVKWSEDGSMSIIPKNSSYAPRTYTREEQQEIPVSIAGVVVELRRKVGGA